jgi:hypothetical protein
MLAGSALFVLRVHARAELRAKDIAVLAIQHLKAQSIPVLWTVSPIGNETLRPSISTVIQGLLYQVLQQNQDLLNPDLGEVSAAKFQNERTESEWVDLLCTLLGRMQHCFIIVETQHLFELNRNDPEWVASYFQLIQRILQRTQGASIKILLLSYYNCKPAIQDATQGYFTALVQQAIPITRSFRSPIVRQKQMQRRRAMRAGH